MPNVKNLTCDELGALLQVCGKRMRESGLSIGAVLDGSETEDICAALTQLLDCEPDRAAEIAAIDSDAFLLAMDSL